MKPTNKQQNSPLGRYVNAYKSWKEAFPEGSENDFKNYLEESYNMWKEAYPNKSLNHFDTFVNNRIDTYKVNQKGWHVWTNEQSERYKKQKQQEKAEATLRFYGYSDEKLKNPNIKAHAIQLANNLNKREEAGKQYMKTVVGGTVGLMGAPYLVTTSIPTLAAIGGGIVGGKAVDKGVNIASDKKYEGFGDAVSDKLTGNTESGWMFDFFNPGYLVGGAVGNRLVTGNFGRGLAFSAAMNKGIKNTTKYGDIRVSDSYFHNPDNAYRATTKAEVQDLRSVGHTRSAASNPKSEYNYTQGIGQGWLKGDSYMQHVENSSNPLTKLKHDNLLRSDGVILETSEGTFIPGYHGKVYGEPQKLSDIKVDIPTKKSYDKYFGWGYKHRDGSFSLGQFPFRGIVTDDSAPLQAENITYFTRGPKGQWIYNGKVLPERRIYQTENQGHSSTLNLNNVLNTKISLSHTFPKKYINDLFNSKHQSLIIPSTSDIPVGWGGYGDNVVLFLKNNVIKKYPHQSYKFDGQSTTVSKIFGENANLKNYTKEELNNVLNKNLNIVKKSQFPNVAKEVSDDERVFVSRLKEYLADDNPNSTPQFDPLKNYSEVHFHSLMPVEDIGGAFIDDENLLPYFKKFNIKTNLDFPEMSLEQVNLDAFRKWITNSNNKVGFKKGGKI